MHVKQVRQRVRVGRDDVVDVRAHERKRLAGERQVQRGIGRAFVKVVRRLDGALVQRGARERTRIVDNRHERIAHARHGVGAISRAQRVRERRVRVRHRRPLVIVQSPLRLARLPGDQRDGVRGRWPYDRLAEVVEQHELLRPRPHERDGVAVEVADIRLGFLLLRERDRCRRRAARGHDVAGPVRRQPLLIQRVPVIRRDAGRGIDMQAVRHPLVAVINRNLIGRIDRHDVPGRRGDSLRHQEGRDLRDIKRGVHVFLNKALGSLGRLGVAQRVEQAIRARKGAEIVVE